MWFCSKICGSQQRKRLSSRDSVLWPFVVLVLKVWSYEYLMCPRHCQKPGARRTKGGKFHQRSQMHAATAKRFSYPAACADAKLTWWQICSCPRLSDGDDVGCLKPQQTFRDTDVRVGRRSKDVC